MNNVTSTDTHADIELLLPWYVNGTLSVVDRERVRTHLQTCVDCHDAVSMCTEMQDSVQQDGPIPILPATTARQILDGIRTSTIQRARSARWQRWSIAATFGFVAMLIVWSLGPGVPTVNINQQFDVATTSGRLDTIDYVLELRFADDVSVDDRQSIIEDLGGSSVTMNADQTHFKIVVRLPPKSLHELEQYAAEIQSRREITSAEIVALQLPVR